MKMLVCLFMLLAALPRAQGADVPRYRITIPSGVIRDDPGGAVQFLGTATALVRVRGLAILIDPGSDDGVTGMPEADVVLLSQPGWHGGPAPWRATPVVAMPGSAAQLRALGMPSVYPLDTWEGITIRKGDTRLRVTSMPDPRGMRPESMAALLDFGPACRVLVHHGALSRDDIALIPQRFPGARVALLRERGTPLLLTMPGGGEPAVARPVARGEPYRFGTPSCK